jgi:two-component system, NtrC family, response regulator AtoC
MSRVLVVDDEEGIREFLAEVLEGAGHEVTETADGEAALSVLGRLGFDLMITDLKMPGMSGLTLFERARQLDPNLEVIVLTAHGSVDAAVQAMKLGAFDFLQKPISGPEQLRLIASRALERRSLLALQERTSLIDLEEPPLTYGDPSMRRVVEALKKVAVTPATVLLLGESGTGKEVAARAVHRWSDRKAGPFVAINCAALAENLLESELFGHEKGAFTGASGLRRGRIELAAGGTFFMDEIGELKPELQAKLLRVLEERSFERIGGGRTIAVDVRYIAATNKNLEETVAKGAFREDLYHRIAVFPVELPPLRERREDLLPLARNLLTRVTSALGKRRLELGPDAEQAILSAEWRGNVRELLNALERAAIVCEGEEIGAEDLHPVGRRSPSVPAKDGPNPAADGQTLDSIERAAIEQALLAVQGNRRLAAERLGIGLRTLYEKLKRYGIG